jgi:hypothetical protein
LDVGQLAAFAENSLNDETNNDCSNKHSVHGEHLELDEEFSVVELDWVKDEGLVQVKLGFFTVLHLNLVGFAHGQVVHYPSKQVEHHDRHQCHFYYF